MDAALERDVVDDTGIPEPVEVPLFFPAGGETLFGLLTEPVTEPNGSAVLILAGGATPVTTNRNRLSVRLCREVAHLGYHGFRLDYHGAGESTGVVEQMRLDRPFDTDADGALDRMESEGIHDFVLAGSCFGSRAALAEAAARAQVRRLILIASPVRDMAIGDRGTVKSADEWSIWRYVRKALHPGTLRRMLDRNHRRVYRSYALEKWRSIVRGVRRRFSGTPNAEADWVSPDYLRQFRSVVDRGVRVLFVYGERDGYYSDFLRARQGELGKLIDAAGSLVEIRVLPGQVHGFTRLTVQDDVLREILAWLGPRQGDAPSGAAPVGNGRGARHHDQTES
jgi:alpha/beta superfamily hydrolase